MHTGTKYRLFVGWAASNEPIKLITEFVAEFELPKNIDRGELIFRRVTARRFYLKQ